MSYPNDRRYTKSHEWAKLVDGVVTVGITHYAQDSLGDIVHVELPEVGQEVQAGKPCAEIESVKSASDIYSPVSGAVVSVNEALDGDPESVNKSPHDEAWMFAVSATEPGELDTMLDAAAYEAYIATL